MTAHFIMFDNTITQRVANFNDHFIEPNLMDIPGPEFEKHPSEYVSAEDWVQCKEFPIIFTLKSNKSYYYCAHAHCNHWYSLNSTFGNIKSHIKSKHLIKRNDIQDFIDDQVNNDGLSIQIPHDIDKLISSKYKAMILKTGRPFSLVSNDDMRSVLTCLGTRQSLSESCERIAMKIISKMKYLLALSSFISVAVDEWSNLSRKRFLGVTARCIHDGKVKIYFLSLQKINSIHLSGIELNNLFNDCLDRYGIKRRVMSAVSDNCNLMTNMFSHSNILRLPCACHLINLLLRAFIKPSENTIHEITAACRCIRTSVCYIALKEDFRDEPTIKNYTEIRWISMYESFKSLIQSKSSIETFYIVEEHNQNEINYKLTSEHWDFIEQLLPTLKVYKQCIKILEGDDFATISLVLNSFHKLKITIESLPKQTFYNNIVSFNAEYSEKMESYKDQFHPLYDAATLLNPFIPNTNIQMNAAIKFIEDKMTNIGWKPQQVSASDNKTISFFSTGEKESVATSRSPVHKLIETGILIPNIEKNESLGNVVFNFWKEKYDQNIDKELAEVAIGLLNAFCTSCSAERFFSKAGRVITRDRMKLMPEVAESQTIIMANPELADKYCTFD